MWRHSVVFCCLAIGRIMLPSYYHHFKESLEGCPSLPSCPETTPVLQRPNQTWLASMIEFPLCVVSWPSYDNTTTVTLMYMMKPPNFAKLIHDKIVVILFETSHRTHVLVYLIAKLHLLFYIQVAITRFEQIIMPVESSSPRESQDPKEDCDHG